jgi:hypothetical protein
MRARDVSNFQTDIVDASAVHGWMVSGIHGQKMNR